MPDSLWRNFTPLDAANLPVITRADGCYIYDQDGKKYLDALAGLMCVNVGYGRKEIAEKVGEQLEKLAYFPSWNSAHPKAIEAADKIAEMSGMSRVSFYSSGSEAVEAAIKLARQYFQIKGRPNKRAIVSRQGAYHGTTLGALSATAIDDLQNPFRPLVGEFYSTPNTLEGSIETMKATVEEIGAENIAAILVEPVQNGGGAMVPSESYFQELSELCRKEDILLISDEVICAWGRLGYMFGSERFSYQPDIIATAKGITSAYIPMAATLASKRVADVFGQDVFLHGSTFSGHPAACAAALANIEILESEELPTRVLQLEGFFQEKLHTLMGNPYVKDIRGCGFFWAIELWNDGKDFTDGEREDLIQNSFSKLMLEKGVRCRAEDADQALIKLVPPLIAGEEEIEIIVEAIRESLEETQAKSKTL